MKFVFNAPTDLVRAIALNPKLYELHLGKPFSPEAGWEPREGVRYFPVIDEEKGHIYGMFSFQALTDKMLDVHIYLLPEYWGTGVSKEMIELMFAYLKEETPYNVLITACPAPAKIARKFVENWAKLDETVIFKNAMTYFGEEVDLHQYVGYIR